MRKREEYKSEEVVKGHLWRYWYTADGQKSRIVEFNAETEDSATRQREGYYSGSGRFTWLNWEPV